VGQKLGLEVYSADAASNISRSKEYIPKNRRNRLNPLTFLKNLFSFWKRFDWFSNNNLF
jgi:hypothetical protein